MVVAEDIILGWDSDPMHRRISASARENIVNAGGDGACGNVLVPHAVPALGRADALGESLNPCFAVSSKRLADCEHIGWQVTDVRWNHLGLTQILLGDLVRDEHKHGWLACGLAIFPFHAHADAAHIWVRLLKVKQLANGCRVPFAYALRVRGCQCYLFFIWFHGDSFSKSWRDFSRHIVTFRVTNAKEVGGTRTSTQPAVRVRLFLRTVF